MAPPAEKPRLSAGIGATGISDELLVIVHVQLLVPYYKTLRRLKSPPPYPIALCTVIAYMYVIPVAVPVPDPGTRRISTCYELCCFQPLVVAEAHHDATAIGRANDLSVVRWSQFNELGRVL